MSRRFPLLMLCLCLLIAPGFAAEPGAVQQEPSRKEQRLRYQEALRYLFSGQQSRFKAVASRLASYPLAPYLDYFDRTQNISSQTYEDIEIFSQRHADSPLPRQLRQSWLYTQARGGRWQRYLEHYKEEETNPVLSCYHPLALYRTGEKKRALELTTGLWLTDHSQPDECNQMFKLWREAGYLTEDVAWQRVSISVKANKPALATYAATFLAKATRPLAELYLEVDRRPAALNSRSRFAADTPKVREIILFGIAKLARQDATETVRLWRQYLQSHRFTQAETDQGHLSLAMQLASQRDPENLIDSLPVNLREEPRLLEARIRLDLFKRDWPQAVAFIKVLPEELQRTPRWQFWNARLLALSNDPTDRAAAAKTYAALAATRGYYGFLAADNLGIPYAMENQPPQLGQDDIQQVEATPGIQRSQELYALGERNRARTEWRFTMRNLSVLERQAAARIAERWGWYAQSIETVLDSEKLNDLVVRFPLAYREIFLAKSRTAAIPLDWTLAIARQESAFMADAKSSAGAVGLMQLMPATAKQTAKQTGLAYRDPKQLIDPVTNISLGTAYLGQMLRRFNNNRILASAAYNAGPGRVDKWMKGNVGDFDVWIETIPFSETRSYVQNILAFAVIFSYRLDQQQQMVLPHEREFFNQQQVSRGSDHRDVNSS